MILTGLCRLGRDAELRYMPDGTAVLGLALAYNYGKKDEQGKRATQWVDASLFGDRAKSLQPYLTKGQQINAYIDDVRIEQFTRRDNTLGTTLRGRISSLEFAGSAAGEKPAQGTSTPSPADAPGATKPAAPRSGGFSDFDDDIPF